MSLCEAIHTKLESGEEKIEGDKWIEMMDEQIFNVKRRGSSVKTRSSNKTNVS